jgi:hypothetical protein
MTYTFVYLDVSRAAFEEVYSKLKDADYGHAFVYDAESRTIAIDMYGIALRCVEPIAAPQEGTK